MRKKYVVVAGLLFGLTACDPTILPAEPKAGDQWTYRFTNYDELGNITGTLDFNYTAHGYVRKSPQFIESWVSLQQDSSGFSSYFPSGDYRMRDDGLYHLTNLSLGGVPTMYLPYPGSIGQAAIYYHPNNLVSSMTIVSLNDTLTVPFGYFSNLYKYEHSNSLSATNNLWFNDSVWFVKYEIMDSLSFDTGVYLSQSIELVDYQAH